MANKWNEFVKENKAKPEYSGMPYKKLLKVLSPIYKAKKDNGDNPKPIQASKPKPKKEQKETKSEPKSKPKLIKYKEVEFSKPEEKTVKFKISETPKATPSPKKETPSPKKETPSPKKETPHPKGDSTLKLKIKRQEKKVRVSAKKIKTLPSGGKKNKQIKDVIKENDVYQGMVKDYKAKGFKIDDSLFLKPRFERSRKNTLRQK